MAKFLRLWIAIPDSCISDEQTKRDKSAKVSQMARACSIFRVSRIYIYPDKTSHRCKDDINILKTILCYLDTPQYLRKILYPHMPELQYAGILHPVKAPHHKKSENIKHLKVGDVRVGVIINFKGVRCVDLGLGTLLPYGGLGMEGEKVNVKVVSSYPNLKVRQASMSDIKDHYWGYEVEHVPNLSGLLSQQTKKTKIIITSRKGSHFETKENSLYECLYSLQNLLIVFGAPKIGVREILACEGQSIKPFDFVVNMFPFQGTETVRLEEAILGTLAILNHVMSKKRYSSINNKL